MSRTITVEDQLRRLYGVREVLVYGGFMLVAHVEDTDIQSLSCSCGWSLLCHNITDAETIEEAINHAPHENYIKTMNLYAQGELSYDGALNFLVMAGMDEDRAEEYLDEQRYNP